jgi:hypothetical protein
MELLLFLYMWYIPIPAAALPLIVGLIMGYRRSR